MANITELIRLYRPKYAAVAGIVVSLLSIGIVSTYGETNDYIAHQTWVAQEIVCDTNLGAGANLCVGVYSRGIPFSAVDGTLVLATEDRVNDQSSLDPIDMILNAIVWSVGFGVLEFGYRYLRKQS